MVERFEVVAAALVKESAAAPAAPAVVSSSYGAEARPQEVSVPSAGLTPPAPILATVAEVSRPPEPPALPVAMVPPVLAPRMSSLLPDMQPGHGAPAASETLEEARAAHSVGMPGADFWMAPSRHVRPSSLGLY